ncbi:MAG TPA: acyl carrier protein [Longimicrobiales bacterium]|nr:acyl carrier protein [Longimicrobiales bacterium]
MTLTQELLRFVREELAGGSPVIDENEPLIDGGLIDSMGLMQLITFIEDRTGVRVPDDEVVPDNFQTVTSIDQLVQRLKAR